MDSSSDNSRFEDRSSFDDNSSFEDILSSKGQLKQLLKWYDDTTGEDNPEFMFSKSGSKSSKCRKVPSPKKPSQTVIVKSHVSIKNCILELTNVETLDLL
ncbi:hypothetical protein Tco_0843569 [Tanacetum coccineum]|uniref:Uncharacterized protein n=1 Tax=Tanacetum coccineum TaxID=301880 RepID=A0ABQ5B4N1_9ASTR